MADIKLLIVAHKPYWMPEDLLYLPIQVGTAPSFLPTRDDTGDHIAGKNPTHCELTAVYWAWKNLPADAVGLAHYRRHFAEPGARGPAQARVLRHDTAARLLAQHDILLPKLRHYYIETNWTQYAHAHHEADLRAAREVLAAQHPEQLPAFDAVMRRRTGHRFNMFIMRRPAFDAYCAWLFPILDALEGRIDPSGYDDYNRRVFGFLAERLLDVWLEASPYTWTDLPVCYLEKQSWIKKGIGLIRRKLRGRRSPLHAGVKCTLKIVRCDTIRTNGVSKEKETTARVAGRYSRGIVDDMDSAGMWSFLFVEEKTYEIFNCRRF